MNSEQSKQSSIHPKKQKPRVLVVHASVGSGHKSAAVSTVQALEILKQRADSELHKGVEVPEDLEIELIDILDYGRIKFDGNKTASMFTGPTRPIYDILWRYNFTGRLLWGGGTAWARIMFPDFTEYIKKNPPFAVICTHITAANVAVGSKMITGQQFPIICVPTDYETEGLWPHEAADLFCVSNEYMAETLRARKVDESRICITGIPVRSPFLAKRDSEEMKKKFGFPEDKTIVLALAGSRLQQPYVHFRETVCGLLEHGKEFPSIHLVVISGADAQYANRVRELASNLELENVSVFEFVDDVAGMMAAADLVICKPGGLTVTECLCSSVPMILVGKAYGQENCNVRMFTSCGIAEHVTTLRELVEALRHYGADPLRIRAMLVNGSYLRKPDAAFAVARRALLLGYKYQNNPRSVKKHFIGMYVGHKPAHKR